jgi:predicted transcriptional regulator
LEKGSSAILLAILPKYADMILSGVKKYEFRRVSPKIKDPIRVLLFTTNGTEQLVGEFVASRSITAPVKQLIEKTLKSVPHDRSELEKYFAGLRYGHAIEIQSPERYEHPISKDEIKKSVPDFTPPQNFIYLSRDDPKYGAIFEIIPDNKVCSPQTGIDSFLSRT